MTPRRLLGFLHLAVGALLAFTLVYQIVDLQIGGGLVPEHYFTFFTILSGYLTVVLLAWTGVSMLRRPIDSAALTTWAWAIVPIGMVTGLVYNLTLRGIPTDDYLGQAWENEIVHVAIPVFLVVDWFVLRLFDPGRPKLRWAPAALVVLVFPTSWVVLTMLRGLLLDGWYPYPFLEPDGPMGVPGILAYVAGIFVFVELMTLAGVAVTRVGRGRRVSADSAGTR